jgi:hypothetical protein
MRLWLRRTSVGAAATLLVVAIGSLAFGLVCPCNLAAAILYIVLSNIALLAALVFAILAILLRPGAFDR